MKCYVGDVRIELTRSEAIENYSWKEDTRVPGSQFEMGKRPFKANSPTDWANVWAAAVEGRVDDIVPDVRVRCYN